VEVMGSDQGMLGKIILWTFLMVKILCECGCLWTPP
jgi:hypothetical protein